MNTTQTRQNIAAAVARRTELVAVAQAATTPRKRAAAYRAVEAADMDVTFAVREHEMAVRASMPGATEAQIQTAARAA